MDSNNPFDLFPAGPRRPAPDPPDNERNRQNSSEFFSAASHSSSATDNFQLTPSEATSYLRAFGSEVTLPGHQSPPSSSIQSQTTTTAPTNDERDTSTISLWMDQMNNNFEQTHNKLDNLTSAITSLVTELRVSRHPIPEMSSTGISFAPTNADNQDDDNISITSQLTQAATAITQSLQELNQHQPSASSGNIAKRIEPLEYDLDKHTDLIKVRAWYTNVISHMADEKKFECLLLPDRSDINPDPSETHHSSNSTLKTQLWSKLSTSLQRALACNTDVRTGTAVLSQIRALFSEDGTNTMNARNADVELKRIRWDMKKSSLGEFTNTFTLLLNTAMMGNISVTPSSMRSDWIEAMPSHQAFTSVKQALWNSSNLPPPWNSVTGPLDLQQATATALQSSGVSRAAFTNLTSSPTGDGNGNDNKNKERTPAPRYDLPPKFASPYDFRKHIRQLAKDGKTRAELETQYKAPFLKSNPGTDTCWLCRFKDKSKHKDSECNLLKDIFPYSQSFNHNSRTRRSTPHPTQSPPTSSVSINMCYDSGTTPFSLIDDPAYFSELVMYSNPQHSLLGDEQHTISTIGQGLIDLVINNTYRIRQTAQLTNKTPTALMATRDHIRYKGCSVQSENGNLRVSFPTFSFITQANSRFEFSISPGKDSELPVL